MESSADPALRTAVLDAARRLLVREGYRELSMRKIARAVGCSPSSIYLYFPSKDTLVHALIYEGFQRWYEESLAIAAAPDSAAERLERLCRRYVEFGLENPELYEVMYLLRPERMTPIPRELYRRARWPLEVAASVVAAAAPERFPEDRDARMATQLLWALLHGVVSTILAGRLDSRVDRRLYIEGAVAQGVRAVIVQPTVPA